MTDPTDIPRCLSAWMELDWRHHSTGLLQAYLPDDASTRIHIWNRGLKLRNSGEMHNHRFDLQSHVLVGSITHTRLLLTPDEESGTHDVWDIPGASQGSSEALRLHDQTSVRGSRVNMEIVDTQRFFEGDSYKVRKWDFHWARQEADDDGLTVTLVRLQNKEADRPASLVYPHGHQPTHAFEDKPDPALMRSIVRKARIHLELRRGC